MSTDPLPYNGLGLSVTVPQLQAPLELVMHDALPSLSPGDFSSSDVIELLPFAEATKAIPPSSRSIADGSGVFLLVMAPAGVGPVTLGTLDSPTFETHVRTATDRALALLRARYTHGNCGTPDCDARRIVRAPFVFGTDDAHVPRVLLEDGRRLRALATLSTTGAFLREISCVVACNTVCVQPPQRDGTCTALEQFAAITPETILTVDGVEEVPSMMSPLESANGTLGELLRLLRAHRLLGPASTYLERLPDARPVQLTMGMFASSDGRLLLPANATVGSTHAGSRSLRSARARMAIGETAGHIASFALNANASPAEIARDPSLLESMRVHLIERGVRIFPVEDGADDPLLQRAVQRLLLQGSTALLETWNGRRLVYKAEATASRAPDPMLVDELIDTRPRTLRSLLLVLVGKEDASNAELFRTGTLNGMIPPKMFALGIEGIMELPIETSMLLKAQELLQHPPKGY